MQLTSQYLAPFPCPFPSPSSTCRLRLSSCRLTPPPPRLPSPPQDVSVPQQFFEHFYLVGALVTTVALQVYLFVCCEGDSATGGTLQVRVC